MERPPITAFVPWILSGAALAAACVLILRLRALAAQAAAHAGECQRLGNDLQAAHEQIEKQAASHRRRGEEMAELHRKLDKAKKRGAQEPRSGHSAAASETQQMARDLEAARQARDAAREEAAGLAKELSRLRSQRVEVPAPAPAVASGIASGIASGVDPERLVRAEQRAEQAEARVAALGEQFATAQKQVQRLRGKHDTQEQLYAALRGELDAKKDRLRRQQEEIERLLALKVALIDPLPPEPAAADEVSPS